MSSAALLKHPVTYMTTEMSNLAAFPPGPALFGPNPYFTGRGRVGEPISPFFNVAMPNQPYAPLDFTGYQYGNLPFTESKPVVVADQVAEQREAVTALLSLNNKSSSGSTTPQSSTPTTMSSTSVSAIRSYGDDHSAPDLISALRMGGTYAPGEHINSTGFDGSRTSSSCMQDSQYPADVKPILVHSYGDASTTITTEVNAMAERSPSTKSRPKSANKSGNNICQICGKSYARPSTLKTHMRTHSGEKPYRCEICAKAFTQAANLTAHLRTHSGEKPFSCPICQKRFSQSSSVTTHLRTHSGERPYRCDYCGKAFADTSTLTKHKRIHSGEKPYRCKICNLGFSQSGNLHRHMKTHNN